MPYPVSSPLHGNRDEIFPTGAREKDEARVGSINYEALSGAAVEFDPLFRTLHVLSPGHYVCRDGGRFLVKREGQVVESMPAHQVNQIVLQGPQALSTGILEFAREFGVGVHFQSLGGDCFGSLHGHSVSDVELHRRQFERDGDEAFKLDTTRSVAAGKIRNCRLVLRRYARNRDDAWLGKARMHMDEAVSALPRAQSLDAIRGHEGAAAKAYFSALAELLGDTWGFHGRNRRPPADPVNAMLSYGYGVLHANLLSAVQRRGLYPFLGVLHSAHHGQPALASDLVEEFRPLVVDSVVLRIALSNGVRREHFEQHEDGCTMSRGAKLKLLHGLESKFNSQLVHPIAGTRMDYRRAMQYQAQLFARAVLGEETGYRAMVLR